MGYFLVLDVFDFCIDEFKVKLVEFCKMFFVLEEVKVGFKRDEKGKGGVEGVKVLEIFILVDYRENEVMEVDSLVIFLFFLV